jgi:hypothetical protein
MNEAEWLACAEPTPLISFLTGNASERKLRLFGVACCRLVWQDLEEPSIRELVVVSESFADGIANLSQLRAVWRDAWDAYGSNQGESGNQDVEESVLGLGEELELARVIRWGKASMIFVDGLSEQVSHSVYSEGNQEGRNRAFADLLRIRDRKAEAIQAALLRDIFGNSFRPAAFSPDWRTDSALSLAQQMYESRDFSAMPILADALQEAGCDNDDILDHCRRDESHVRGCWVVDLVLAKK